MNGSIGEYRAEVATVGLSGSRIFCFVRISIEPENSVAVWNENTGRNALKVLCSRAPLGNSCSVVLESAQYQHRLLSAQCTWEHAHGFYDN